jgi:hypothetical protein
MPKLALIGQAAFGNTKKIAGELQKGGWSVDVLDADKPKQFKHGRMPTGVEIVLIMVGHLPGGAGQRVKDGCRGHKIRFLEIPPDWSGASALLQKYNLMPAPAVIPNLAPVVQQTEIFTSGPTNGLRQRPFANLDKKHVEAKPPIVVKAALYPTAPVAPPPVPPNGHGKEVTVTTPTNSGPPASWKPALKATGEMSPPVNSYIASLIEKSAEAGKVAEKMLREGLATIPTGDGHAKYCEAQKAAKQHAIGDTLWRRLRRQVRKEMGLPDDTAWWAGRSHGVFTPADRKQIAKDIMHEHPEWPANRVVDEVREKCGLGIANEWVRREMDKQRRKEKSTAQRALAMGLTPLQPTPPAPTQPPQPSFPPTWPLSAMPPPPAVQAAFPQQGDKAMAAVTAAIVASTVPKAEGNKEDELKAAIDLLKSVLKGSKITSVVFSLQPDGEYKAKTMKPRIDVEEAEY